ncbi:MAG: hypothetical protein Q9175_006149 [Cornicularia normoerica]
MNKVATVTPYRDHHKVIKAIETCSLQATFGPEVISTGALVPKKPDVSSVITIRASQDSCVNPVQKRIRFNKIPFFSAKPHKNTRLLPIDETNEDGNIPSDLTTNNGGMPAILTKQDGNIFSICTTRDSGMPAFSTHEDAMTSFRQSNYLGQVPREIWGQKVSYHAYTFSSVNFANILPVARLKNFADGPARREPIATSMTYPTQITSIQTTTVSGSQRIFSASAAPKIP